MPRRPKFKSKGLKGHKLDNLKMIRSRERAGLKSIKQADRDFVQAVKELIEVGAKVKLPAVQP